MTFPGLRRAGLALSLFLSVREGEASDSFLASLKEVEDVYVGTAKLFYETQPVHPGCTDSLAYILNAFGLPANALDLASMMGTSISKCKPNIPEIQMLKVSEEGDSDEANEALSFDAPLVQEYVADETTEWSPEEMAYFESVSTEIRTLWQETLEEVAEEFQPRDHLGYARNPYTYTERGVSALKKLLAKASQNDEIKGFMRALLAGAGRLPPAPSPRGAANMAMLCITNVPDVMVGLLVSKTTGQLLVNLAEILEILDGPGMLDMSIAGVFKKNDLGTTLCNAVDFSITGRDFDPQWIVCGLANAVAAFISCGSAPLDCTAITTAAATPPVVAPKCDKLLADGSDPHPGSTGPEWLDVTLQPSDSFYDADGNINQATLDLEGYIYFYDFRATTFQAQFTSESGCAVPRVLPEFIPGWNRVAEIFLNEPASTMHEENNQDYLAFATISRKNTTCEWHVSQRGTFNTFEWVINFEAEQEPVPYSEPADGTWHRGYGGIVKVVGPLMDDFFSRYIGDDKECQYAESKIHFAGHSLGGGMVEAYAMHFVSVWQARGVAIETVTFAPARALNVAAMDYVSQRANMRSVVNAMDTVPRLPCKNKLGMPRCDSRKYFTFAGAGRDPTYSEHPNILPITFEDLETLNATKFSHWDLNIGITATTSLEITMKINAIPSHLDMAIQHVDIYHCYFAKHYCTDKDTVIVTGCA